MGKKKSLKNCCNHSKKDKQCIANGKVYDLPRKFSKKKCIPFKKVKGFTKRSSCTPYKSCKPRSKRKKRKTKKKRRSRKRIN